MERRKKPDKDIVRCQRKISQRPDDIGDDIGMSQGNRFRERFASGSKEQNRWTITLYLWNTEKPRGNKRPYFSGQTHSFQKLFEKYIFVRNLLGPVILHLLIKALAREHMVDLCKIDAVKKCSLPDRPVEHNGNFPGEIGRNEEK